MVIELIHESKSNKFKKKKKAILPVLNILDLVVLLLALQKGRCVMEHHLKVQKHHFEFEC